MTNRTVRNCLPMGFLLVFFFAHPLSTYAEVSRKAQQRFHPDPYWDDLNEVRLCTQKDSCGKPNRYCWGGAAWDPGGAEEPTAESSGLRRRKALSTSG